MVGGGQAVGAARRTEDEVETGVVDGIRESNRLMSLLVFSIANV